MEVHDINHTFTENELNYNTFMGVEFYQFSNSTVSHNTMNYNRAGFTLDTSCNYNTFFNNTLHSNKREGIWTEHSIGNNISSNNIRNCSSDGSYACIYLRYASDTIVENNIINNSAGYGIWILSYSSTDSSNNTFKNTNMTNIVNTAVFLDDNSGSQNLNNTFINFTYNNETVDSNSELIRKWYYQAYVNDTSGNNVSGANVTAYNVLSAYQFNLTTDSTGYTSLGEIIDYINTGTRNYYSNYTIYATNPSYLTGNHTYNVTSNENNYEDVFTLTSAPNVVSECTILDSPGNYVMNQSITNNSLTGPCINITAQNITLDCAGFYIKSDDAKAGVYSNQINTTIKNCNVTMKSGSSGGYGIYLVEANYSYIYNSTLNGQKYGFYLLNTSNTRIENITANSNGQYGIYLSYSSNNILTDNTANSNSNYGIYLSYSSNNILTDNIANSNSRYGIYLSSSSNNNQLTNNTANSNQGISVGYGIYLSSSSNNNQLTNNTANSNSKYGIYLSSSSNNILINNNMSGNTYNFYISGSSNEHFNNTIDTTNTVDYSYKIYYNYSISNYTFDATTAPNAGVVVCAKCDNVTYKNLNLSHYNYRGILFFNTTNSKIENVTANSNQYGIHLSSSSNNNLTDSAANNNTATGIVISGSNNIITNNTANSNELDGFGIWGSNNNTFINNTANLNYWAGMYGCGSNSTFINNTVNSNGAYGFDIYGGPFSTQINNTLIGNTANFNDIGIVIHENSNNHQVINNTANSNSWYGIYLGSTTNNNLTNNNIWNCTSTTEGCLYLSNADNNIISEGIINLSASNLIYLGTNSDNNIFSDIELIGATKNDTFLTTPSINNTFLNVSYNISKEYVASGSQLIRKWYYRAYVNDTSGLNVSGANVTAYNVSGTYNFNLTTNSTGWTSIGEIIDYINTGTRNYYSNYTIYATNPSYLTGNHTYNVTSNENNYKDVFTLQVEGVTACGNLSTANTVYTLQNNVSSTGTCFNITADNITLDMNNHNATGDANSVTAYYGIKINGCNNISIKNGGIYNFGYGIYAIGNNLNISGMNIKSQYSKSDNFCFVYGIYMNANNSIIENVNSSDNKITTCTWNYNYGIYLTSGTNNRLINNTANSHGFDATWDPGYGIEADHETNLTLINNTINSNANYGFYLYYSPYSTLIENNMSNNSFNFRMAGSLDSDFNNTIYPDNLVDGKRIYYNFSINNYIFNLDSVPDAGIVYCPKCDNITIRDLNLSSSNGESIIFSNTTNSYIINNSLSRSLYGISLSRSINNQVLNNTITTKDFSALQQRAIALWSNSNNNTIDGNFIFSNSGGVYINSGTNNIIKNNILSLNTEGIFVWANNNSIIANNLTSNMGGIELRSKFNNLTDNNILNCTTTSYDCLYLSNADNNIISGGIINLSARNLIYLETNSDNNIFQNIQLIGATKNDTFLTSTSINNTFLNVSYNISKEYVASGSQLIRKWYYQAYVNDTSGLNVSGANVTAYNVSGTYNFNLTTDTTGYTSLGEIIDYVRTGGTKVYYSNYTIYASNTSCVTSNHTFNSSLGNNYGDLFTLSCQSCGDGTCNINESCSTCPSDCGSCPRSACHQEWSCGAWSSCTDDQRTRNCTCGCSNDNDCYGDHQTSQACECDSAADCPTLACYSASCTDSTCSYSPKAGPCDDNDTCTQNDTCSNGVCLPGTYTCQCHTDSDCNDGSACTADSCVAGTCQHLSINITCSDNNACTENDYCANGACVPGNNTCECLTDADCANGNACTADSCLNNTCQLAYTSDPCDDANNCTANDYCMDGACTPGPFTCPCQTDADCNDNNPCTDESCVSTVCTYSDANASCDDGSDCTLNDYCSNGLCAPGKDTCRKACNDAWSCTDWGACVGGTQSRTCNCACGDRCTGDSDMTRACVTEDLRLDVFATQELLVGDPLQINVSDQSGNPVAAQIELVRPDGSTINLGVNAGVTYTVDRPGLWTTRASKVGYIGDEAESTVVKITPALGVEQIANTVENSIALLKDDRVRASLLTVTVIIILFLLVRGRRRKEKIKKL